MKQTLDFNKMSRAQIARKKWVQVQIDKELEKANLQTNQESITRAKETNSELRKSS